MKEYESKQRPVTDQRLIFVPLQLRTPSYAMTSSSPADLSMGPFARLAQATYLLDQVLRHIGDTAIPERDEEAIQLDQALRALAAFTVNETTRRKIKLCCYTALCNRSAPSPHDV
jgi:hypothetical protein